MSEEFFTLDEVAEILGRTRQTVDGLVESRMLRSETIGGLTVVTYEELLKHFLSIKPVQRPTSVPAEITRREFLIGGAASALGTAVGGSVTLFASKFWESSKDRVNEELKEKARETEVKSIFREFFRHPGPTWSLSLGRRTYSAGYHPDNLATGKVLIAPLGLLEQKPLPVPSNWDIEIISNGDVLVIGGANSTPLTSIAFEMEGPNDYELNRVKQPIIPLRFYGIADKTDPSLVHDVRIGWQLEGVGPVSTVNWPYVDTKTGKRLRPQPGERIIVEGEDAFIPSDNYLLVTRIPNFLAPDFRSMLRLDRSVWPHILVIEGSHGPGTRAAELFLSGEGLRAIESAKSHLGLANEFQALFRVTNIRLTDEGFHKFHAIELVDAESLDYIDTRTYQRAYNKYVIKRTPPF